MKTPALHRLELYAHAGKLVDEMLQTHRIRHAGLRDDAVDELAAWFWTHRGEFAVTPPTALIIDEMAARRIDRFVADH